ITYITTKVNEEQKVARNSKPIVTYSFIGLIVAVFLWVTFQGGSTDTFNLIKWGGKFNPLIYAGEWWRFISPIFLHSGLIHLASNAVMLYIVGAWAERIYGKWRYILILLLGGICGNIASFALNMNLSVGASTAVFAVMGALLYLVVLKPNLYAKTIGTSIASLVAINLLIDVFSTQIDIAGHIGGLVGGFLLAGALSLPKQFFHWRRLAYGVSLVAVAILFLYFGFQKGEQPYDPMSANIAVQQYLQEHNKKEATKIIDNLIESGSADGYSYTYASSIALQNKQIDKAEDMANEAISLDKDIPEAHYYLSFCYRVQGNIKGALKEANTAKQLSSNPFFDSYYDELEKSKE
ncbi:TPA: rhomboid family intramembrane serine protease, partial [Listeria innocua]